MSAKAYRYPNLPPRLDHFVAPPKDPGEGFRFLIERMETVEPGDDFWAEARGCWVEIRDENYFSQIYDGDPVVRREIILSKEDEETKETSKA